MHINSEVLLNQYIPFNKPVPCNNFYIHPIRLCDMPECSPALDILQTDKNSLGQVELISMSNLRFILLVLESSEPHAESFEILIRKALNVPEDYTIQKYVNEVSEFLIIGKLLDITDNDVIYEEETVIRIEADEFNFIKDVILYQTYPDYTNKYIDPDVKRMTEEYYRLKNKDAKNVTLEHKMTCVQAKTGMTLEAIGNLTIRNFFQLFDVVVGEVEYKLQKGAELNGTSFKEPIEHWAYKEKKDKYAEAFCDADSFVGQIQNAN